MAFTDDDKAWVAQLLDSKLDGARAAMVVHLWPRTQEDAA